jgi:hypothetical protein
MLGTCTSHLIDLIHLVDEINSQAKKGIIQHSVTIATSCGGLSVVHHTIKAVVTAKIARIQY